MEFYASFVVILVTYLCMCLRTSCGRPPNIVFVLTDDQDVEIGGMVSTSLMPVIAWKCGGVSITDSVFSVSLKCIGLAGKTRFFAPNFLTDKRPGMYFGPLLGGTGAHILLFAIASGFRVTRVIVEFRRKFGIFFCKSGPRYSCQNFIPHGPCLLYTSPSPRD